VALVWRFSNGAIWSTCFTSSTITITVIIIIKTVPKLKSQVVKWNGHDSGIWPKENCIHFCEKLFFGGFLLNAV